MLPGFLYIKKGYGMDIQSEADRFHGIKRPRFTRKIALVSVATITVVAVALLIITLGPTKQQESVQAFRIGEKSELPQPGKIEKDATVKADKQIQVVARYDFKKLQQARVQFLDSSGKEAFNTGLFQLSDQGTFSVSIGPKVLKAGKYSIKLLNEKDATVLSGSLKVTE